jgi:hypothetical protein
VKFIFFLHIIYKMAITWRQHVKQTMSRMEKGTHLKDVLKEASKTWSSVKKGTSSALESVVGKPARGRSRTHKRGRKGSKAKSHKHHKGRKTRKGSRRHRRGGSVVPANESASKGGVGQLTPAPY